MTFSGERGGPRTSEGREFDGCRCPPWSPSLSLRSHTHTAPGARLASNSSAVLGVKDHGEIYKIHTNILNIHKSSAGNANSQSPARTSCFRLQLCFRDIGSPMVSILCTVHVPGDRKGGGCREGVQQEGRPRSSHPMHRLITQPTAVDSLQRSLRRRAPCLAYLHPVGHPRACDGVSISEEALLWTNPWFSNLESSGAF